jgi:hypothetical protein
VLHRRAVVGALSGVGHPVDLRLQRLDTRWASSAFGFTTGRHPFTGLPDAAVLAGEDATVHARGVVTEIDGRPLPDEPLVVRYNPVGTTGWLIGVHRVGRGRLVLCQYRLVHEVLSGDPAARALLADLVHLVQGARP